MKMKPKEAFSDKNGNGWQWCIWESRVYTLHLLNTPPLLSSCARRLQIFRGKKTDLNHCYGVSPFCFLFFLIICIMSCFAALHFRSIIGRSCLFSVLLYFFLFCIVWRLFRSFLGAFVAS